MIRGKVEKVVEGGYGLIRTEEGVVLCLRTLPGEVVDFEPLEMQRGVKWARLAGVIEPSAFRKEPECPHYSDCGGCDFMHVTREAEVRIKCESAAETLRRTSGFALPVEFRGEITKGEGYRNAVRLQGGAGYLGYFRKGTEEIVDIEDCLIAEDAIREEIRRRKSEPDPSSPKSLTIKASSADELVPGFEKTVISRATKAGEAVDSGSCVNIVLRGNRFRVSMGSFFQVNTSVAGNLIDELRAGLPEGDRFLDCFAGVGTFAVSLADRYRAITGYEISKSALEDFRFNASRFAHIDVRKWDAAKGIKDHVSEDDVLLLDPPRLGLPARLTSEICAWNPRPRAVAYISCDAATLGRDLKRLLGAGYALSGPIRLFDMFPRTAHVEMIAFLEAAHQ